MHCAQRVLGKKFEWTRTVTKIAITGLSSSLVSSSSSTLFQSERSIEHQSKGSFSPVTLSVRYYSSNRASIVRVSRLQYLRQYPTLVVNPDGSTFTIRYHEPRKIIKLPLDISGFTEQERKAHLERRRPKTRVKLDDDIEDDGFDAQKYLNFVKK